MVAYVTQLLLAIPETRRMPMSVILVLFNAVLENHTVHNCPRVRGFYTANLRINTIKCTLYMLSCIRCFHVLFPGHIDKVMVL